MCKCDPRKKTPYCGGPGCEIPYQLPKMNFGQTIREMEEDLERMREADRVLDFYRNIFPHLNPVLQRNLTKEILTNCGISQDEINKMF